MESCIEDPHQELVTLFHQQNLRLVVNKFILVRNQSLNFRAFVDLLAEDRVDVNIEYDEKTILQTVVEAGRFDFAKELLRVPACDPNRPNKLSKKVALHLAVEKGSLELTKLLLDCGADINAKMQNGNTALHIAAQRSAANWAKSEEKYQMILNMREIVRLLLSYDNINFDMENIHEMTPIFFAAEKGTEDVVKLLLDKGACITNTVDGESVEDWINKRMPGALKGIDTSKNRQSNNTAEALLFKALYNELTNPGGFASKLEELQQEKRKINLDYDDGGYTLLQYCCDLGYHQLVDLLLSQGADPNHVGANNRIPPVVWAAHHGFHLVVRVFKRKFLQGEIFVDFAKTDESIRRENVLHKVLKAESKAYINKELRNYSECLKLLLTEDDERFKNNIAAAINGQDNLGNTPLHIAAQVGNHDTVRKLLRCEANLGLKNARGLTPIVHIAPDIMEEFLDDCLESENLPTDDKFQITFKYSFLGPPRMRKYSIGAEPLLAGQGEDDEGKVTELPETEPLWYMSQIREHRHLLTHPTITSFLWMKWRKIRPYFYTNVCLYLAFFTLLTSYVLLQTQENDEGIGTATATTTALKWATFVFLVIFSVREAFQLSVSYRRYIFNIENLMESSLIVLTYSLMFAPLSPLSTKLISAVILLLSWFEVVLLIGGHPRLSTYISMFSKISFNFTKFLSLFLSIIISFGLCFFIMFHHPPGAKNPDGEDINPYFETPSKALMKTIIMSLTGEIEFENIEFSTELGKIVFLLFVFFIMLVLVNLLNGLAVSDIALIQKEAEIMSQVSRVELMCHIESILLGDPFFFLTNFPELPKAARKLPNCNIFASLYRVSCVQKLFSLVGSRNFLLFSERLKRKEAVFLPNKSKKERSNGTAARNDLILPESILEAARGLVIRKNTITEEQEMKKRLTDMEKALKLLAEQQNYVITLLQDVKS